MKKIFFVAAIILLLQNNVSLFAQKSLVEYDLSSYELPEMKRQTLQIQFDLNQNRSYNNQRADFDTVHSHSTYFSSNLNPSYTYYLNSKKFQVSSYTNVDLLDFEYSRTYQETYRYKHQTFSPSIFHDGEYRNYLNKKLFIEADIIAGVDFEQNVDKEADVENNRINSYATIPIMIGVGRIERVEDARLAVYILSDMKKHNQLDRDLDQSEITAFAQFLSKLLNERFFDSREKKIYALQKIDSFMVANNLIKQSDVLSTSLINDNWDYANGPTRETGFRIAGGISNGYSYSRNKYINPNNINNNSNTSFIYNLYLTGNLKYEKPINLYWQFSVSDKIEAGPSFRSEIYELNDDEDKRKYSSYSAINSLDVGLGYYPNSRTSIVVSSNLNSQYLHTVNKSENANEETDESDSFSYSAGIQLTSTYYFSRQLQMSLNSGFYHNFTETSREAYTENDITRNNSGRVYVNIGFIYKLL